ncbi:MAG: hypothetical protein WCX30_01840 [Candidatus Paceibacterota bacterium]|jgi:hypothetical protein|nr:hypothetical protein [bacterium]
MQIERVHQVIGGATLYNLEEDRRIAFFNGIREIPEKSPLTQRRRLSMEAISEEMGITPLTRTVDEVITSEHEKWRPKILAY